MVSKDIELEVFVCGFYVLLFPGQKGPEYFNMRMRTELLCDMVGGIWKEARCVCICVDRARDDQTR